MPARAKPPSSRELIVRVPLGQIVVVRFEPEPPTPVVAPNGDLGGQPQGRERPMALTFTQAARELGVHRHTVGEWVRDGALPAVQIGGKARIRREDLERWLGERPAWRGEANDRGT
jgi:excisionase family DNA binding protein